MADITIPDDTQFEPGDTFTKTWSIRNSGTCTWNSSYTYRFVSGDQLSGPDSFPISGIVAPGAVINLSVNLVAPTAPKTYKGGWRMHNPGNAPFGSTPFVQIIVASPTSTPTITATPTITSTPTQTATASATPTGIDLVISSASVIGSANIIYVVPQPANPTTTFNFNVRVKNIGTAGALGSFVDGLVQGSQKLLCLAPPLDAKNVVPLAPAEESADVNVSVDVVGYGSFIIEFSADYCGVIDENSEGNNTTIVTVTVS